MGYKENKKYIKRCLYGLYVFIYMPWFFTLEHFIQPDMPGIHILNTPLDDKIPFCEYFIIPYILWFFYVVGSCIFMIYKASDKEFVQFALSLIIGMSLALTICMIYPNGLTLRPSYIPDNICGKIVKGLYKTLKNKPAVRYASLVLCILICMSTIFLKQHSVLDVIGGFALMAVMYVFIYVIDYKKIIKR